MAAVTQERKNLAFLIVTVAVCLSVPSFVSEVSQFQAWAYLLAIGGVIVYAVGARWHLFVKLGVTCAISLLLSLLALLPTEAWERVSNNRYIFINPFSVGAFVILLFLAYVGCKRFAQGFDPFLLASIFSMVGLIHFELAGCDGGVLLAVTLLFLGVALGGAVLSLKRGINAAGLAALFISAHLLFKIYSNIASHWACFGFWMSEMV